MRVVRDTNILVSALLKPASSPATVLLLAFLGHFELCISQEVLEEYEDVLRRPRLRLSLADIEATLSMVRQIGRLAQPTSRLRISKDETDNRFYECAQSARADYIVTGNRRHFTQDLPPTEVVTVREFLDRNPR